MNELSRSLYRIATISEDHKFYKTIWTTATENINLDQVKAEILQSAKEILEYKPMFFMADETERRFPFDVDIQQWVAQTIAMACIQAGVKKMALIMPNDILVEMSTEQTVDEAGKLPFELQYFYDHSKALQWFGI